MNTEDSKFMQRAIQLARCGEATTMPNPMVGAVIVCNGSIVGEGYHRKYGGPHAEVNAVENARANSRWCSLRKGTDREFAGCAIYVTLEPCSHWGKTPPCCELIVKCGFDRVVIGTQDPNSKVNGEGIRRIKEAGIDVTVGVMEKECRSINPCFLTYHGRHRPYVTLKWAQMIDGTMGCRMSEGERLRMSTKFTEMLVHRLRARCQAIMVGTNTMLTDKPSLTTRLWRGNSPLRVTIDRRGRLKDAGNAGLETPESKEYNSDVETLVYGNEILPEILFDLHKRGVQHLLVEGGSKLLQSFINEGLWDDARVEICSTMECGSMSVAEEGRVMAPKLSNAKVCSESLVDGNKLLIFINTSHI